MGRYRHIHVKRGSGKGWTTVWSSSTGCTSPHRRGTPSCSWAVASICKTYSSGRWGRCPWSSQGRGGDVLSRHHVRLHEQHILSSGAFVDQWLDLGVGHGDISQESWQTDQKFFIDHRVLWVLQYLKDIFFVALLTDKLENSWSIADNLDYVSLFLDRQTICSVHDHRKDALEVGQQACVGLFMDDESEDEDLDRLDIVPGKVTSWPKEEVDELVWDDSKL